MNSAFAFALIPIIIDAIAVLGLYVIATSGRLSVGHAAFLGIGAYTAGVASVFAGLPPMVSILLAIVVSGGVGALFALIVDRLNHWFFAISTLAFTVIVIGIVSAWDTLGGASGFVGVPLVIAFPEALVALVLVIAFVIWLEASLLGRKIVAVRDSEMTAEAIGISVRKVRIIAFAIGTGIAGLAGGLWAHYLGFVQPHDMSLEKSLLFIIFLSIGGTQFWGGALVGAIGLGLLPDVLRFSREYRIAIFGALLTFVMVVRPQGLISREDIRKIALWARAAGRKRTPGPVE